jgi:hypothetical protein
VVVAAAPVGRIDDYHVCGGPERAPLHRLDVRDGGHDLHPAVIEDARHAVPADVVVVHDHHPNGPAADACQVHFDTSWSPGEEVKITGIHG